MKKKSILLSCFLFILYFIISVVFYLNTSYVVEDVELNNINKSITIQSEDEELFPVGYYDYIEDIDHWGYVTKSGDVAISMRFKEAGEFNDDHLAIVKNSSKYGVINKYGRVVIDFQYSRIDYLGNSMYYFQNGKGKYLVKYTNYEFTQISEVDYDEIGPFSNGLAYVIKDKKVGYIDVNGTRVIDLKFDDRNESFDYSFMVDIAFVYEQDQIGIINKTGNYIIEPIFKEVIIPDSNYDTTLYPFLENDTWGYVNNKGEIVIPAQYKEAYPFSKENLALVSTDGESFDYINKDQLFVFDEGYTDAYDFYNQYATVEGPLGYGLIDINGNIILDLKYDFVGVVKYNYVVVEKDQKVSLYNISNQEMTEIDYRFVSDMTLGSIVFASNRKDYYILNRYGNRIYKELVVYDYLEENDKLMITAFEKKYYLEYYTIINENGEIIWKPYK